MLMLVMASMGLLGGNNNEFDACYAFDNADGDFKELPFSVFPENTAPSIMFPWENTAGNNVQSSENTASNTVQWLENTAHNNFQSLENTASNTSQSQNNTHDHLQTQFLHSAANQIAPMLPAELMLPVSQINHNHLPPHNGRWSDDEHKLFLFGLHKHGKGDWINISKIVQTRTPTQVASHAQKYFIRQASAHKGKRRSINDIVLPDNRPVPHQIYQQIGVSFPTLNGPLSHHIDQQNGAPFSYLNGAVPHHIDHQNLVAFPNFDLHHLHGIHPLVPHHINLQNPVASPNLAMPQLHGMHHSVPHNINQRH